MQLIDQIASVLAIAKTDLSDDQDVIRRVCWHFGVSRPAVLEIIWHRYAELKDKARVMMVTP